MHAATFSDTLPLSSRELALELFALLRELDPAGWRESLVAALRERLRRVKERVEALLAAAPPTGEFGAGLYLRLQELAGVLEEYTPQGRPGAEGIEAWMRLRSQLTLHYDALARALREHEVHVPSLRPTNYHRNLFHLGSAVLCLVLIEVVLSQAQLAIAAGSVMIWAWSCELLRRRWPAVNRVLMGMMGRVAHPHEYWRVNSATWFSTAIAILALTGAPILQIAGVVILGIGDPVAAIVGRRYGRHKLIHGRSVEGSAAFVLSAAIPCALLLGWRQGLAPMDAALVAGGAALAGAVTELFSRRVDDNFSIPLSAAAGAWGVLVLLGLA